MDRKTHREVEDLLSALLDGVLSREQQDRLSTLLEEYPEARRLYLSYFALHAELELLDKGKVAGAMVTVGEGGIRKKQERQPLRLSRFLWTGLGFAGLAAGLLLLASAWRNEPNPGASHDVKSPVEQTHQTIAVLLHAPGAEWEETGMPTGVGAPLPAGQLRLKSGFAQIEFCSGARVILEGPADFQLISAREAFCSRGKLRASVPPQAHGFAIRSPKWDFVDRGTEFGLQIGENGQTELHVFQGKVDLYDQGADREFAAQQELKTGEGVRLNGDTVQAIALNPSSFLTAREVAKRSQVETERRQQAWSAAVRTARRDPSLVIHHTFEPEEVWSRTLRNEAGGGRQAVEEVPTDGAIVGCAWVTGRWPGKQGLEFRRVNDRVRLDVPGAFQSVTLLAWVRVDALPNLNNSLFMTDGWDVGEFHWQIGEAGKLVLGVKAPVGTANGHYHALDVFRPERFGQWTHLAVVYDNELGQVTHYIDGQPASSSPVLFRVPLTVGDAEIGNWNMASLTDKQPIRNLSGCMDEFMFYSRALSAEEIQKLYSVGKPSVVAPATSPQRGVRP